MRSLREVEQRLRGGETLRQIAVSRQLELPKPRPYTQPVSPLKRWRGIASTVFLLRAKYRKGCYLTTWAEPEYTRITLVRHDTRYELTAVPNDRVVRMTQALLDELHRLRAAEEKAA